MKVLASELCSKNRSRDEAVFLAASPLVTGPPSNLTRLYCNGSAAKSHSTTTQYRQLRRLGVDECLLRNGLFCAWAIHFVGNLGIFCTDNHTTSEN